MFLKIAVLSNSGNVGKSMICDSVLSPRIPNCEVIKIETINGDGTNDEKLSAEQIGLIQTKINNNNVCILDIGASNIELFMRNMKKMNGAIEDLDYFFIPTTKTPKQQQDALNTITQLLSLGVDISYIKIIFNYYNPAFSMTEQYGVIFDDALADVLDLNNPANQFCIEETQMFKFLKQTGLSYNEILNDTRDFKKLIRATKDKEERALLTLEQMAFRFAQGFDNDLNEVFRKIKTACNFDFNDVEEIA
jgi:hypothetical protein